MLSGMRLVMKSGNGGNQEEIWREDDELRNEVRPLLADVGETAQFLAMKGLVLNNGARDRFLDWLFDDLWQALTRIIRITQGDYSPDNYRERFPNFVGPGQRPDPATTIRGMGC